MKLMHLVLSIMTISGMAALGGQTVSVASFLDDGSDEPQLRPYLEDLTSGAMDGLFYSGLIATSQRPAARTKEEILLSLPDLASKALEEHVGYLFIIIAKDRPTLSDGVETWQLEYLEYMMVDCSQGSILGSGTMPGPEDKGQSAEDFRLWCLEKGAEALKDGISDMIGYEEGKS